MTTTWRLIITENMPGSWNMALDESLLYSAGAKITPPTLRIYGWNPGTLSLGYAQPVQNVDVSRLSCEGWDLVRRPTGGRAILHIDELTYSVTAPLDDPILTGSLLESYHTISRALIHGLERLKIDCSADKEYELPGASISPNPICFESPSNYEITYHGRKLIGSAQARKHNGLLQHGSLPLFGDLKRITRVLNYEDESARQLAARRLLERATTIELITGRMLPFQQVEDSIIEGFSSTLGIQFQNSAPLPDEFTMAQELMDTKYDSANWTFRI